MEDGEEMDSLFEGMVLFTPSQFSNQGIDPAKTSENLPPQSDDSSRTAAAGTAAEPLDENLFSDLTVVAPAETLAEACDPVSGSSSVPPPSFATTVSAGTASVAIKTTKFSRQVSRRKKRAAGLRIGYGRDTSAQHHENNQDDEDDDAVSQQSDTFSQQSDAFSQQLDAFSQQSDTVSGSLGLDHVKAQIAERLSRARHLAASVSAARKDAIRKRRQAAENLRLVFAKHAELEKQLEEACEAEDFEAAERISESVAAADRERQALVVSLRQAESYCDALDSKMQEVLLSQISLEEECASLLRGFSTEAENDADSLLKNAETFSSEEMRRWLSSIEAVEARKFELDIESHIVDNARLSLNGSLDQSVEQDLREKESLCKKKDNLADELQELLALVKAKEKEIEENDLRIKAVEEKIADAVSGYKEMQASMDAKYDDLQSGLSQVDKETEALSRKKKEIDEFIAAEKDRGAKLRDLSRVSADEAKEYEEVVELRKSLMSYVSKAREERMKLVNTEEKLSEDVQILQQEVSNTRESLKDLSSKRSSIQQNMASFKEKILFIDKRMPELEAEKKVAAAARNFKEAARIASEAKSLSLEKDNIQTEMQEATSELGKADYSIEETVNKLQEIEGLIISKEKEVAIARFQRLGIDAGAATAERSAALELGNLEEANLLLAEAQEAESEAEKLKPACGIKEEELVKSPKRFISMELLANLGLKQLAELAESVNLHSTSGST